MKVLKLYSQTCAPCKELAPKLEEVADKFRDLVIESYDVGTPDGRGLAVAYRVRSVPTVLITDEDEGGLHVVDFFTGNKTAPELYNFFRDYFVQKEI